MDKEIKKKKTKKKKKKERKKSMVYNGPVRNHVIMRLFRVCINLLFDQTFVHGLYTHVALYWGYKYTKKDSCPFCRSQ